MMAAPDRVLATKVRELKVLKGARRVASCAKAYTAAKRALRRAERHVVKIAVKAEVWQ